MNAGAQLQFSFLSCLDSSLWVHLPSSGHPVWKCPHRYTQRCLSTVTMNSTKGTRTITEKDVSLLLGPSLPTCPASFLSASQPC